MLKLNTIGAPLDGAAVAVGVLIAIGVFVGGSVLVGAGGATVAVAAGRGVVVVVSSGASVLLGTAVGGCTRAANVIPTVGFAPGVTTAVGPDGIRTGVGDEAQATKKIRSIEPAANRNIRTPRRSREEGSRRGLCRIIVKRRESYFSNSTMVSIRCFNVSAGSSLRPECAAETWMIVLRGATSQ